MTHISCVDRSIYDLYFHLSRDISTVYNLDRILLLYPITILYTIKIDRARGRKCNVEREGERERDEWIVGFLNV